MRLKLTELEPEWVADYGVHSERGHRRGDDLTIATAQGVVFVDPVEFTKNGGLVGSSSVLCWFRGRGVPDDALPGPGRWEVSGSGFDDLTLSPSIDLTDHGKHPDWWHGWVQNGIVR